ncbi:Dol-P-Man:Man(7)GlcNAc(2)-PP-Dol alpha-1,6-mannosyltransferase, family GT22 [Zostera marina]|uniref:Mannosyltransferase n=1 Tax=Zostera marina TaxID=29655 RepID=A0A0K9PFR5_ZOSMR|nr:Dol-P-Man:Man(7)GlcNAc(2)-PP-Dol alpha-1,6-mannosyltransferase, family GT22 [Zostera marina]
MATRKEVVVPPNRDSCSFLQRFGWDLLLGSITTFYVIAVPYTKVEESFNVQAMHDILYHRQHLQKYDHFEFPGVVPRTFIGAFSVSILSSPVVLAVQFFHLPKLYGLLVVRLTLGCIVLSGLSFFRREVKRKFGFHVEAFFVILTALQFHLLFYCTRPLPNIFAFFLVNMSYGFWFKGNFLATLRCLTIATIVFRCDTVLLFGPIALELLLSKSISLLKSIKCCIIAALFSIGFTVLIDTIMWGKLSWPELEVFWFNSILNRSSEWGTHSFHWYFTSALPRSLLVAYPLCLLGMLFDKRILRYIIPVFSFVLVYSKLPHKELRFIIGSLPLFNVSAAIVASRVYNNRRKNVWKLLYFMMLASFLVSLGCSIIAFMASYNNYPAGYALKTLHEIGKYSADRSHKWVHIDTFAATNGISRFCEKSSSWSYSKEEGIALEDYQLKNFTYLLNEHPNIDGFKCLFTENGFTSVRYQFGFPPLTLLKLPKVFIHGNLRNQYAFSRKWPGCP